MNRGVADFNNQYTKKFVTTYSTSTSAYPNSAIAEWRGCDFFYNLQEIVTAEN